AEQGETLKVGETLVHLTNVEQTLVDTNEEAQGDPPATSQNNNQRAETTVDMQEKPITKRVKAAPSIRKAAREAGVDLSLITPTGPSGRVLRKDLEKYLARKDDPVHMFTEVDKIVEEPAKEDKVVPIQGMRKVIFDNMKTAQSKAVHCTGMDEVDVKRLVAASSNLMPYAEQLHIKLTYLPFVIKAVAIALQKQPIFNSTVNDEAMKITYRKDIHIGVAMAIEEGLVV